MTRPLGLLLTGLVLLTLAGCGANRSALAKQTVQTYWSNISHGKFQQAWNMLTPGDQQAVPVGTYSQNVMGLLTKAANIRANVGKPRVNGDQAAVPLVLTSVVGDEHLHACQHLFWLNGAWRISDQNGGLSKTC